MLSTFKTIITYNSTTKSASDPVISFRLWKETTTNYVTSLVFVYTVKLWIKGRVAVLVSVLYLIFTTRFMDSIVDIQGPDTPVML